MDKQHCLIVEDEPIAAEILVDYVGQVPFLELAGVCPDAIYALEVLQTKRIDLLFLDIHLPKLKGLDFLRSLPNPPKTILTTAYEEYALDAFEEGVIDYLMKPIEFSRFLKAIQKVRAAAPIASSVSTTGDPRPHQFFTVNKRRVKVYFSEVTYVESLKDYCRIFVAPKPLTVRGNLGEIAPPFLSRGFLRIHRSFLVAKDKISSFTASDVEVDGKLIPIGRSYRETVRRALDGLNPT